MPHHSELDRRESALNRSRTLSGFLNGKDIELASHVVKMTRNLQEKLGEQWVETALGPLFLTAQCAKVFPETEPLNKMHSGVLMLTLIGYELSNVTDVQLFLPEIIIASLDNNLIDPARLRKEPIAITGIVEGIMCGGVQLSHIKPKLQDITPDTIKINPN